VLEEPTRGVDIGTKREIYQLTRDMAATGTAIVWWSTENAELLEVFAYVASSLLASFSGLLTISYILNAEPTAGSSLMLQAIAAVVIGGASLLGGTGTAVGAVLGALMITVIQNGVNLIGINSFWQGSVTGLAILIAVLIDRFSKSRRGAV